MTCFDYGGAPASTATFTLLVTRPIARPHGVLDFAWIQFPAKSYVLKGAYQYNSSHLRNAVRHLGRGRYLVAMPGPRPSGTGTVKITSYAATAGDCNLAKWIGTSNAELFYVDCYSSAGRLQNTSFGIVYARNNNLMGQNGLTDASAFASRPRAARYQPHLQFDSHRGARVTAVRVRTGIYDVFFAGSQGPASDPNGGGGDVQVTAAGRTDTHCAIADWLQAPRPFAEVVCRNNSGNLVNSKFTSQWVVA